MIAGASDGRAPARWRVHQIGEHFERRFAGLTGRVRVPARSCVRDLETPGAQAVPHPRGDLYKWDAGSEQPGREGVTQVVERERDAGRGLSRLPDVAVEVANRPELPSWGGEEVGRVNRSP